MRTFKPAWSKQFADDALPWLEPVAPFDAITGEWAWGGSYGAGVKVAVIDSGIDADHPAIGGPVQGYMAIHKQGDDLVYVDAPHTDVFGHGNACAGIIRGIAPDCELYSIHVLDTNLSSQGEIFLAGIRWAIEHGIQVCNLSLGTTNRVHYAAMHELVDRAYFLNMVLVAAANNIAVPSFPSVFASVISVAAHSGSDPYQFYYNPHPPMEFGAPGVDVRVAWSNKEYLTVTGNSFAAPHISGIVARILSKHPGLTPFQIKAILRALAANMRRSALPEDA